MGLSNPQHTGRRGARIIAASREDALALLRWLEHYAPGLRTELEEAEHRFPVVRVGCDHAAANALADIYARIGRADQEGRDAAFTEGGWEE